MTIVHRSYRPPGVAANTAGEHLVGDYRDELLAGLLLIRPAPSPRRVGGRLRAPVGIDAAVVALAERLAERLGRRTASRAL